MTNGLFFGLTLLTALGSGLMAGAMFVFSNMVLAGLRNTSTPTAIAAMQALNGAVDRSLFLAVFTGTGVLSLVLAVSVPFRWDGPASVLLLAGSLLYLVVIAVTRIVHLPRNAVLMTTDPTTRESAAWWAEFTPVWNTWNRVRTLAALFATGLLVLSLTV